MTDAEILWRTKANALLDRQEGISEDRYVALRQEAVERGYADAVAHLDRSVGATDGFFYFEWDEYKLPVPTFVWIVSPTILSQPMQAFANELDARRSDPTAFVRRIEVLGEPMDVEVAW